MPPPCCRQPIGSMGHTPRERCRQTRESGTAAKMGWVAHSHPMKLDSLQAVQPPQGSNPWQLRMQSSRPRAPKVSADAVTTACRLCQHNIQSLSKQQRLQPSLTQPKSPTWRQPLGHPFAGRQMSEQCESHPTYNPTTLLPAKVAGRCGNNQQHMEAHDRCDLQKQNLHGRGL